MDLLSSKKKIINNTKNNLLNAFKFYFFLKIKNKSIIPKSLFFNEILSFKNLNTLIFLLFPRMKCSFYGVKGHNIVTCEGRYFKMSRLS